MKELIPKQLRSLRILLIFLCFILVDLQECVGRQGAEVSTELIDWIVQRQILPQYLTMQQCLSFQNFKHGISILTKADYFALGNRINSFTTIAFHVAQFPEYRRKIINHVFRIKLHHWDNNVRELASKSLHGLTSFEPRYVADIVIPCLLKTSLDPKDIPIRHGSILGLGEAVLALSKNQDRLEEYLPKETLTVIAEIVPTIEKNRLYRGRGGEIVRGAVCDLIRSLCAAKVPMVARQQVRNDR